jgi:small subunit ribosomal protein S20
MANTKSAKKAARKSDARRAVNQQNRSELRGLIRRFRAAVAAGQLKEAKTMLPGVLSLVDRSVRKRLLHRRTAARQKSRLMGALRRAQTAKAA